MKNVALHNLGCKVNSYEIEVMQENLEKNGYKIVPFAPGADVYIINTCTVTNIADRKSRQMLHKAKKMNPDAIVVAVGCYVQTGTENVKQDGASFFSFDFSIYYYDTYFPKLQYVFPFSKTIPSKKIRLSTQKHLYIQYII